MTPEECLVGAVFLDPKVYTEAGLLPEQFMNPKLAAAWRTIADMVTAGEIPDPITVAERTRGIDASYLSQFVLKTPKHGHENWATSIRNAWTTRELSVLTSDLPSDPAEALRIAEQRLSAITQSSGRSLPSLDHCLSDTLENVKNPRAVTGLPTGLAIENVVPAGLPLGRVTAIFGESGNYKSTVSNNLAWNVAASGASVLYVSLEDSDELVTQRFLARYTGVPYGLLSAPNLLSTTDRSRALQVSSDVKDIAKRVIMGGELPPNIEEIVRMARYHKYHDGVQAVFIDYVQLLDGGTDHEGLARICRAAQLAAKRDNLAYVLVSQVKQDVDMRDDHRPRITDMLGGSSLRTASKLSIGVYRPAKYEFEPKKRSPYYDLYHNNPDGPELWKGMLELHLKKNVVGEDDVVVLCTVDPPTGMITPFDRSML